VPSGPSASRHLRQSELHDPASYDVVVAGAGPAGAATALRLAAAGRSVAVVERSRFDRPRVGETLAPSVQPLLRALGAWDRFVALRPLPSWGVRSVWADPEPAEHPHLASGWGSGWHVDRCAVDRMLADAAAAAGVHVLTGTTVTGCRYDGATWQVVCSRRILHARVLVDATGRSASVGRLLGGRRHAFDRLVAVATTWSDRDVTDQCHLLLEATGDGWWYTAPLPGDALVAMLLTDADLCRTGGLTDPTRWAARLRSTDVTVARTGAAAPAAAPRVHPAASHRLLRTGDPRPWLAVGDAALAVDPLSGSGFVRALRMAEDAARTVSGLLDGADPAGYEARRDQECTAHLVERAQHYGAVRRFATPFWTRRALARAA
jgi:flavin-dependent dehydrogenase